MLRNTFIACTFPVVAYVAWQIFASPYRAPGAYLHTEPAQRFNFAPPIQHGDDKIFPLAWYQLDALVVARKKYDEPLSPLDIGVVWGPLLEQDRYKEIDFRHSDRFLHFSGDLGPEHNRLMQSVANVHLIPADDYVRAYLETIKTGDYVSLQGNLVQVMGPNMAWSSSLNRRDRGDGACEVFYVTHATHFNPEQPGLAIQPTTLATRPQNRTPAANQQPKQVVTATSRANATERITLTRPLEIPVDGGTVLVPANDYLTIIEQQAEQTHAKYRNFEFWINTDQLFDAVTTN